MTRRVRHDELLQDVLANVAATPDLRLREVITSFRRREVCEARRAMSAARRAG